MKIMRPDVLTQPCFLQVMALKQSVEIKKIASKKDVLKQMINNFQSRWFDESAKDFNGDNNLFTSFNSRKQMGINAREDYYGPPIFDIETQDFQ